LRIYQITPKGVRMARSVNSERTPAMVVLYYMDKHGSVSGEQVAEYTGLDPQSASGALRKLRHNGLVQEI
jgi:DNA-binding MarR family transcriptional regulator